MSSHVCPVGACSSQVPDHMLMCGRHWRLVSSNLQSRLYRAWARGRGAGSDEHAEAMRLCIEEVEHKLTEGAER